MHPLQEQIKNRQGVVSFCTANEIVLEAAMEDAVTRKCNILIEATANQVNQFGGYTGMKPTDYMNFVRRLAQKVCLDQRQLIVGGDHLGPLIWQNEVEAVAMKKAEELVTSYVEAGFTKIHLDTSMRLGDDPQNQPLSTETIARRGALLAKAAINALRRQHVSCHDGQELVFVIGSEVPIPGGAHENEEGISVTSPNDFIKTVTIYQDVFEDEGLSQIWNNVIGVVVQPGVEFSENVVFQYNHEAAEGLVRCLDGYPNLVFEGHSTDYQTLDSLANMVRDGVAILKVGPELTFSLREGLIALTRIEEELIAEHQRSYFRSVLDDVMCREPGYWEEYYHGTIMEQKLARMFSYSDRCRYYLGNAAVSSAIERLFDNIDTADVPLNVLHQYLPSVCDALTKGSKKATARELVKNYLRHGVICKYQRAALEQVHQVCGI